MRLCACGRRCFADVDAARDPLRAAAVGGDVVGAEEAQQLHALRFGDDLREGGVGHEAEFADAGFPAIAEQRGAGGLGFAGEVAVAHFGGERGHEAFGVEGHVRAQVDRAGETAFDHVGGGVLVRVDAGHELGRDVAERQATRAVRVEAVTAVEFAAHLRQAANHDARRLGGEVRGVAGRGETRDGDAAHALQGFGDRLVGERADVGGGDRVDDGVGLLS